MQLWQYYKCGWSQRKMQRAQSHHLVTYNFKNAWTACYSKTCITVLKTGFLSHIKTEVLPTGKQCHVFQTTELFTDTAVRTLQPEPYVQYIKNVFNLLCKLQVNYFRLSSALCTGWPLPPEISSGTHFCWRLSKSQGHTAAGRIR
jgi:hypothetical protein